MRELRSFHRRYQAFVLLPVLVIVIVLIMFGVKVALHLYRHSQARVRARAILTSAGVLILIVVNYFLFPMAAFIFNVYNCERDDTDGVRYMTNSPNLRCDYISPGEKVVPLLAFVIGPVLLMFFLVSGRFWARASLGNYLADLASVWTKPFRREYDLFCGLFMLRRLLLSLVVSLASRTDLYRHVVVLVTLVSTGVCSLSFKPFVHDFASILELSTSLLAALMYVDAVLVDDASSEETKRKAASVFLICCASAGLLFLYAALRPFVWGRSMLERRK